MKWAKVFAFLTIVELGAFVGALTGTTWRGALTWCVVFLCVTHLLAVNSGGQR